MTRKLDFIVYGMPRGGTTAVTRYLCAMKGVHCGNELFPMMLDHAALDVPEAFVTPREGTRLTAAGIAALRPDLDRIGLFGNKTPTYFYRLPGLLAELDHCPSVACIRSLRSVAASYSMRAAMTADHTWPPGRVGLIAMGDALLLLRALASLPAAADVLIVPQAATLADWQAVMARVLAHISPGSEPEYDPDRLREIHKIRRRDARRAKPELADVEKRALARLRKDGVADFMARDQVLRLAEIRDEIAAILARTPPDPAGFVMRLAERHPDPAVAEYAAAWARRARRALQHFRAAAG